MTTHLHPEWKELFKQIGDQINENPDKKLYLYDELTKIAGINIQSSRGRQQFEHFNRECRKLLNIHWENVRSKGYRIVKASEHAKCAVNRIKKAGKQMKKGKHIIEATALEKLTETQKSKNLMLMSIFGTIVEHIRTQSVAMQKIACAIESPKMIDEKVIDETLKMFKQNDGLKN